MLRGPRPTPLILSDDHRRVLTGWTRHPTTAQALALRARIVLACADHPEQTQGQIARTYGVSRNTVLKWRQRFAARGL